MPGVRVKDVNDLKFVREGLSHVVEVLKGRGEDGLVERLERMLKIVDGIIEYAERSHARELEKRRLRYRLRKVKKRFKIVDWR